VIWLRSSIRKPEEHRRLSPAELAHIQSDREDNSTASVPWMRIIPRRETWAFALAKALTDPVWWFYLFWLPGYLQSAIRYHRGRLAFAVIIAGLLLVWQASRVSSRRAGA